MLNNLLHHDNLLYKNKIKAITSFRLLNAKQFIIDVVTKEQRY